MISLSSTLLVSTTYTSGEAIGVGFLVAAGCLSLISVLTLLSIIVVSSCRSKGSQEDHAFVRTHVAAYFVSLLLCDLIQSVGSIINISWITHMGVTNNGLCVAQGAIKQTGNVGGAIWTMIITIHTFFLLFFRTEIPRWVCYVTLGSGWLLLGFVLSLGPGLIANKDDGPFYGISGLWCWIGRDYYWEHLTLEYNWMFAAVAISFILYTLLFFRLRGNITLDGRKISFQRRQVVKGHTSRQFNVITDPSQNTRVLKVARQMLWYPIAHTILVGPVAAVRLAEFGGINVPYQVTVCVAAFLMLSGFVDTILFTTTRRIIPSTFLPSFIRKGLGISTATDTNTTIHQRSFVGSKLSAVGPKTYGIRDTWDEEDLHRNTRTSSVGSFNQDISGIKSSDLQDIPLGTQHLSPPIHRYGAQKSTISGASVYQNTSDLRSHNLLGVYAYGSPHGTSDTDVGYHNHAL